MLSKLIMAILPKMPQSFVWLFSKKYIVGRSLEEAISVSQKLNEGGCRITIDLLGEFIEDAQEAMENKEAYMKILDELKANNINGGVSVKPTFFGLLLDEKMCFENIREVVKKAHSYGIFVRIDMEDSQCTDRELDMYEKLHTEFPNTVGLVLQAYLHRTMSDVERLEKNIHSPENPINIRLCKGIYVEDESISYKKYQEINDNYVKILKKLFDIKAFVGIATHDKNLTDIAYKLIEDKQISQEMYEFQMLYGVQPKLRRHTLSKGHPMKVYLPYGKDWFGYSIRRLQENPNMVMHITKSVFRF